MVLVLVLVLVLGDLKLVGDLLLGRLDLNLVLGHGPGCFDLDLVLDDLELDLDLVLDLVCSPSCFRDVIKVLMLFDSSRKSSLQPSVVKPEWAVSSHLVLVPGAW